MKQLRSNALSWAQAHDCANMRQIRFSPGSNATIPWRSSAILLIVASLAMMCLAPKAEAVLTTTFTMSGTSAGEFVSAKAVFAIDSGSHKITLTLTNLTLDPDKPAQLLTGLIFSTQDPDGAITNLQLTSATAISRTVNSDGTFADSGTVDLLSLNTWELNDPLLASDPSQGDYNISFHPDATYGIIGDPGADHKYPAGSNQQGGQSPYAAQTATFVFYSPLIVDNDTSIDKVTFRFGTAFEGTVSAVPEGSAAFPLIGTLALAGFVQFGRRRRIAAGPIAPTPSVE